MDSQQVPPILMMGPTGSGKTGLAVALAARLRLGVVSIDSALVYRGLDIGAAKPDRATLAAMPHELVDIADPEVPYSTGNFLRDVLPAMQRVRNRGEVPLLVGGTMLWFRALQAGLATLPGRDEAVRSLLEREASRIGWPALHARLREIDPQAAARIHCNDAQRIQRALEVHRLTGRSLSELQAEDLRGALAGDAPGELGTALRGALKLALVPTDRAELHGRLARRFREMMAAGFLEEVQRLRARPALHAELPAVRAVGYRQLWSYLDGEIPLEGAVEQGIAATRQLAKRQLTWLRREPAVEFLPSPPKEEQAIERLLVHGVPRRA